MILAEGMMAKGFNLEIKRQVVDDYKSNRYTVTQVANKHGVSEAAVYKWVKEDSRGELAEPKETRALREVKITKTQIAEIISDYVDKNIGARKLASKYNVTPTSIKHILKREGVYEGVEGAKKRQCKITDTTLKSMLEDYSVYSIPVSAIASKYGVSEGYVRLIMHNNGVTRKDGKKQKHLNSVRHQLKDQVIADYKTGEHTHKTIADKYGVSTRTISRILDSAGVEAIGGKKLASATEVADKMDDVVSLADQGKGVFDIAADTGMSVGTVKHILENDKREKARAEDTLKARIAELHSQGLTLKDIAKAADMSVYLVKKIIDELGLEPNSPSDKHRPCVVELCKQGMSADSIASQVGLSVPTVRKILHEEGLTPSKGDSEVKKRVLELFKQGMKAPQIASECGISAPTVRKIIATSWQVKDLNERIVELYDGGMEIEQIAQEVGLNRPLVMIELSKAMKEGTLYRPFFPESDISVIKYLASKWTTPDKIASHLGCDENYIRRFLQLPDKKI